MKWKLFMHHWKSLANAEQYIQTMKCFLRWFMLAWLLALGKNKKHVQHVYADIIIFSPSIITTILVLFGSLTSISPCFPCFRCSYNMIKYTFIIIRNLQSVLHHRLTDILIILGELVPWSESVYLRLHAGLPRQ